MSSAPIHETFETLEALDERCRRLEREIARERAIRKEAENIAEHGLRELYLSRDNLHLLNRISAYANDSDAPNSALRFALQEICGKQGWAIGHALLRTEPDGDERLEGSDIWVAKNEDRAAPFIEACRNTVAWPCASAPGRLFLEQHPIWTRDLYLQHDFTRAAAARHAGLCSSISVPVIMGHELVGAMEFYQTELSEPSEELMDLLLQIGIQLGRVFNRRRHADTLLRNALSDSLTGLPNRTAFEAAITTIFEKEQQEEKYQTAIIYVDMDGFKLVNDTLGHNAGDTLIVAMADRVRSVVENHRRHPWIEDILLARVGGDEFVILVRSADVGDVADDIATEIHDCLHPVHRIGLNDVQAVASIGIALNGPEYTHPQELLRDADVAMYEAKAQGPEQTYHFTTELRNAALSRLDLEVELRRAVENSAFELNFQPIVCLSSKRIAGFEALVRWRRDTDTIIMPDEFIPTAEACGLIVALGTWVLREACRAAVRFHMRNDSNPELYVSVNVALQQFQQLHFVKLVRDILLETGAHPSWIRLELTESTAATNPTHAARTITHLHEMGIQVSIDDFGTGYSSLAHLQAMPFDTLKIDRSFITKHSDDSADWSFVVAMKQLADSLGMKVIVEGIENEFQQAELESFGCEFGQGWLFGKPQSEELLLANGW